MTQKNMASNMEGTTLDGGWVVKGKVDSEIGCFSSAYTVIHDTTGAVGFLKVLNYEYALNNTDGGAMSTDNISKLTNQFNYERDLYKFCEENGIKSVIRSIAYGDYRDPACPFFPMPYIIMEYADGGSVDRDVRMNDLNLQWRLSIFHGIAKALQQLHRGDVAHKDLHSGNILLQVRSAKEEVRIGDLGRADKKDELRHLMGKRSTWAYEIHYGNQPNDWEWSISYDCFCLGALLYDLLTDNHVAVAVFMKLDDAYRPPHLGGSWGRSYRDVLPYIETAFYEVMRELSDHLETFGRINSFNSCILQIIESLCHPNPRSRSHKDNYKEEFGSTDYSLQRIISNADWLAKKAGWMRV